MGVLLMLFRFIIKMNVTENEISKIVFDLSLKIHRQYGPGLLESVYEEIFCYELSKMHIPFRRQPGIPVIHEGVCMQIGFRADLIIENKVIIDFKSIDEFSDVHFKVLHTYLKLTNIKLGLLINFNVSLLKNGFRRVVNRL